MQEVYQGVLPGRVLQRRWLAGFYVVLLLVFLLTHNTWAQSGRLAISPPQTNGWVQVGWDEPWDNMVYTLRASTNLLEWAEIATLHNSPFSFIDPAAPTFAQRYYSLAKRSRTEDDDWKNQIEHPYDSFSHSTGSFDEPRWLKFAIVLSDPVRVVYQNSLKYPFHYNFAVTRLEPFKGMTREQFDAVSLRAANQKVILGAVLMPPETPTTEVGVQFVGLDPYPKEVIRDLIELVRSTIAAPEETQLFYMPTYEQSLAAERDRSFFESNGIPVSTVDRWIAGDTCYSHGWALGRLKFIPAQEINAAYVDGRLRPEDILLTDGVPAEVPFVSGIITLTAATPNSHVAILARSYGVPFVYFAGESERARVLALDGKEVVLRSFEQQGACEGRVIEAGGRLSDELRNELNDLKQVAPIQVTPKAVLGSFHASTEALVPADIRYFGGKASHYGLLRRVIPSNAPVAMAFSFDLWDGFLDQVLPGGRTLRDEIADRLARYSYPVTNMAALKADLEAVRELLTDTAQFSEAQQQAVTSALVSFGFNINHNIRFRSSTNVEDSERFSGAGLYDSFSGCLADDLDFDNSGPSHCDPSEDKERGVFRALRKVYASFYNDNAFLERLRHSIDEDVVGMAVLVHHSFPDEIELANGVATARAQNRDLSGDLVTQLGATSVTNPDKNLKPEVLRFSRSQFGTFLNVRQWSTLVPLGANVMTWDADYKEFVEMFARVTQAYQEAVPGKTDVTLDFEYKKVAPSDLVVKQVREIPAPDTQGSLVPFLIQAPLELVVFQGEYGNVFANHRLKSRWQLASKSMRLEATNLTASLYANANVEFLDGTNLATLSGALSQWPEASYKFSNRQAMDRWKWNGDEVDSHYQLITESIFSSVSKTENPVFQLSDYQLTFHADYSRPMPVIEGGGRETGTTTNDSVLLIPRRLPAEGDLLQTRRLTNEAGVTIETRFYWPKRPRGFSAGYTAPLLDWVETTIAGLTTQPIRLVGYYSQTYRPEHHNVSESFIFEPGLEADLSEATKKELRDANVRLIYLYSNFGGFAAQIMGWDGVFRPLDGKGEQLQSDGPDTR